MTTFASEAQQLVARLEGLPYSERIREASLFGRRHKDNAELPAFLEELAKHDEHPDPIMMEADGDDGMQILDNSLTNTGERFLAHQTAAFAASAARTKPVLTSITCSSSRLLKKFGVREVVRTSSDEEICQLIRSQPPGTRSKLVHACVAARRHSVLDVIVPELLSQFETHNLASSALNGCSSEVVRKHFPSAKNPDLFNICRFHSAVIFDLIEDEVKNAITAHRVDVLKKWFDRLGRGRSSSALSNLVRQSDDCVRRWFSLLTKYEMPEQTSRYSYQLVELFEPFLERLLRVVPVELVKLLKGLHNPATPNHSGWNNVPSSFWGLEEIRKYVPFEVALDFVNDVSQRYGHFVQPDGSISCPFFDVRGSITDFIQHYPVEQTLQLTRVLLDRLLQDHPAVVCCDLAGRSLKACCDLLASTAKSWQTHWTSLVSRTLVELQSMYDEAHKKNREEGMKLAVGGQIKALGWFGLTDEQMFEQLTPHMKPKSTFSELIRIAISATGCEEAVVRQDLKAGLGRIDKQSKWPQYTTIGRLETVVTLRSQMGVNEVFFDNSVLKRLSESLIIHTQEPMRALLELIGPVCKRKLPSHVMEDVTGPNRISSKELQNLFVPKNERGNLVPEVATRVEALKTLFDAILAPIVEDATSDKAKSQVVSEWADQNGAMQGLCDDLFDCFLGPLPLIRIYSSCSPQCDISVLTDFIHYPWVALSPEKRFAEWKRIFGEVEERCSSSYSSDPQRYLVSNTKLAKELANSAIYLHIMHRPQAVEYLARSCMPELCVEAVLSAPQALRSSFTDLFVGLPPVALQRFVKSLQPAERLAAVQKLVLDAPVSTWERSSVTKWTREVNSRRKSVDNPDDVQMTQAADFIPDECLNSMLTSLMSCLWSGESTDRVEERRHLTAEESFQVFSRLEQTLFIAALKDTTFRMMGFLTDLIRLLGPETRQEVISRLTTSKEASSALKESLLPLGDIRDKTLRVQLHKACKSHTEADRLKALENLLTCSLLSESTVELLSALRKIRESTKNEAWERRAAVYSMVLSHRPLIVKTFVQFGLPENVNDLREVLVAQLMSDVLEAQEMFANPFDRSKKSHPLYLLWGLSTELIQQKSFDAGHPLFALGVALQWEVMSKLHGNDKAAQNFTIAGLDHAIRKIASYQVDTLEDRFNLRKQLAEGFSIAATNCLETVRTQLTQSCAGQMQRNIVRQLLSIMGPEWARAEITLSGVYNMLEVAKSQGKNDEGLHICVDHYPVFAHLLNSHKKRSQKVTALGTLTILPWFEIPVLVQFMDYYVQSVFAPYVLFTWLGHEIRKYGKDKRHQGRHDAALKLLSISPSAVHLDFVHRFLLRARQDLLAPFLVSPGVFPGIFYKTQNRVLKPPTVTGDLASYKEDNDIGANSSGRERGGRGRGRGRARARGRGGRARGGRVARGARGGRGGRGARGGRGGRGARGGRGGRGGRQAHDILADDGDDTAVAIVNEKCAANDFEYYSKGGVAPGGVAELPDPAVLANSQSADLFSNDATARHMFNFVLTRGLWRTTPAFCRALASQFLKRAQNSATPTHLRMDIMRKWTLVPTVTYSSIVEALQAESWPKAVEIALLKGLLHTDDPIAPLYYVLTPSFLESDKSRIVIYTVMRSISHMTPERLLELLSATLEGPRRKSLTNKITVYKQIVRLFNELPLKHHARLLLSEMRGPQPPYSRDPHRDIHVLLVQAAVSLLNRAQSETEEYEMLWTLLTTSVSRKDPEKLIALLTVKPQSANFSIASVQPQTSLRGVENITKQLDSMSHMKLNPRDTSRFVKDVLLPLSLKTDLPDLSHVAFCQLSKFATDAESSLLICNALESILCAPVSIGESVSREVKARESKAWEAAAVCLTSLCYQPRAPSISFDRLVGTLQKLIDAYFASANDRVVCAELSARLTQFVSHCPAPDYSDNGVSVPVKVTHPDIDRLVAQLQRCAPFFDHDILKIRLGMLHPDRAKTSQLTLSHGTHLLMDGARIAVDCPRLANAVHSTVTDWLRTLADSTSTRALTPALFDFMALQSNQNDDSGLAVVFEEMLLHAIQLCPVKPKHPLKPLSHVALAALTQGMLRRLESSASPLDATSTLVNLASRILTISENTCDSVSGLVDVFVQEWLLGDDGGASPKAKKPRHEGGPGEPRRFVLRMTLDVFRVAAPTFLDRFPGLLCPLTDVLMDHCLLFVDHVVDLITTQGPHPNDCAEFALIKAIVEDSLHSQGLLGPSSSREALHAATSLHATLPVPFAESEAPKQAHKRRLQGLNLLQKSSNRLHSNQRFVDAQPLLCLAHITKCIKLSTTPQQISEVLDSVTRLVQLTMQITGTITYPTATTLLSATTVAVLEAVSEEQERAQEWRVACFEKLVKMYSTCSLAFTSNNATVEGFAPALTLCLSHTHFKEATQLKSMYSAVGSLLTTLAGLDPAPAVAPLFEACIDKCLVDANAVSGSISPAPTTPTVLEAGFTIAETTKPRCMRLITASLRQMTALPDEVQLMAETNICDSRDETLLKTIAQQRSLVQVMASYSMHHRTYSADSSGIWDVHHVLPFICQHPTQPFVVCTALDLVRYMSGSFEAELYTDAVTKAAGLLASVCDSRTTATDKELLVLARLRDNLSTKFTTALKDQLLDEHWSLLESAITTLISRVDVQERVLQACGLLSKLPRICTNEPSHPVLLSLARAAAPFLNITDQAALVPMACSEQARCLNEATRERDRVVSKAKETRQPIPTQKTIVEIIAVANAATCSKLAIKLAEATLQACLQRCAAANDPESVEQSLDILRKAFETSFVVLPPVSVEGLAVVSCNAVVAYLQDPRFAFKRARMLQSLEFLEKRIKEGIETELGDQVNSPALSVSSYVVFISKLRTATLTAAPASTPLSTNTQFALKELGFRLCSWFGDATKIPGSRPRQMVWREECLALLAEFATDLEGDIAWRARELLVD